MYLILLFFNEKVYSVKSVIKIMNWYKLAQSEKISITPKESLIFDLIKKARDKYAPGISLRVAGGWVRDRVIGKISDDIDIAVSGGDGIRLAEAVSRYDMEITGGARTGKPFSVSLEKTADPNKKNSSGLMVGGIDIDDIKVEFVPMRKEEYSKDSRVPSIIGTDDPKDDVKRRDLTINALYYNIDTGVVEDYVNGISDLKNGIIKTPNDPLITFTEDPLRVLRALRFLSQMNGFRLDPGLLKSLNSEEIKKAYLNKVAPERAKKEIEKIVTGKNPEEAIRILFATNLYLTVFGSPKMKNFKNISMDQVSSYHSLSLLEHTVQVVKNINNILIEAGASDKERMIAVLAAMFHDFGKMDPNISKPSKSKPGTFSYHGHEYVSADVAEEVLKRLGFGNERFLVQKIVEQHMRPHGEIDNPKSIGKFIREFDSIPFEDESKSNLWKLTYLHAIADSMSKGAVNWEDIKRKHNDISTIQDFINNQVKIGKKPLLDGKEIMKMFPELNPKTGFIKKMQEALLEAQDSGIVVDKNSAENYLKNNSKKFI